ncbi:MAG: hypothetical protein BWY83_03419 [bacterium ADurb.Bin478]|nr:MAG: hypothetical protein BWY83_03419 [bacterium ADurb.Bin478]
MQGLILQRYQPCNAVFPAAFFQEIAAHLPVDKCQSDMMVDQFFHVQQIFRHFLGHDAGLDQSLGADIAAHGADYRVPGSQVGIAPKNQIIAFAFVQTDFIHQNGVGQRHPVGTTGIEPDAGNHIAPTGPRLFQDPRPGAEPYLGIIPRRLERHPGDLDSRPVIRHVFAVIGFVVV